MKIFATFTLTAVSAAILGSASAATVVIDFTTEGSAAMPLTTGDLLDVGTSLTALPFTVDVVEEMATGLLLTVVSGSSFDPVDTTVNGAGGSFGVNSPTPMGGSENASRFDVDAAEQLIISFSQDVFLLEVDLVNLTGMEQFTVGSVTGINDTNTTSGDMFDFTGVGATDGIFVTAGTGILLEATGPAGTSVGLQGLTINTVPEPSFSLILSAGCMGLLFRRRR